MGFRRLLGGFGVLSLLLTAGCASFTENAYQKILIRTPGAQDAECELTSNNTKMLAYPPQRVQVSRVYDALRVTCFAPGGREKTVEIIPKASPVVLLNAATGILPGLALDHESGAMYRLPDTIDVDFTAINLVAERPPSYENKDTLPVLTRGLDSETPGFPGLDRDSPWPSVPRKIDRTAAPVVLERPPVSTPSVESGPASSESLTRRYNPGVFVGPARNEEK